jgi:isoleucyl-tRNA synthetase
MPYSTKCNTVLSNFEAGSNYQDTKDPAIYITFPLVDDPEVSLMAWTTTPWTLPSNLAAAVNPNFVYLKIHDEKRNKKFIVAQSRMADVAKQCGMGDKFKVLEELKGTDLVGKKYTPLFDYFKDLGEDGGLCFTVIAGNFVTEGAGTGIVHCAPGFGDDDYKVCVENKLIKPGKAVMPIDEDGCFNNMVPDYKGVYFKDADKDITKVLKDRERLVQSGTVVHSYPYCWRSDTPLMYRAVDTWFI